MRFFAGGIGDRKRIVGSPSPDCLFSQNAVRRPHEPFWEAIQKRLTPFLRLGELHLCDVVAQNEIMLSFWWQLLRFIYFGVLVGVLYLLVRPVVRGAIFFPTKNERVKVVLEMADVGPGQKIADIGSGDGRILIAFARKGIEAHGYEINPLLVLRSRWAICRAHLGNRAFVHWKDFWKISLSGFDAVIIYGMPRILKDFEDKVEKEVVAGTKVISIIYKFPKRNAVAVKDKIYAYRIGE